MSLKESFKTTANRRELLFVNTAGQSQWIPGVEGGVVFAGWENRPIKLGFIYCLNRRSVFLS